MYHNKQKEKSIVSPKNDRGRSTVHNAHPSNNNMGCTSMHALTPLCSVKEHL